MRSLNPYTFSRLKLNFNLKRKLKLSNLTVVVNTMIERAMSKAFCIFSQRVWNCSAIHHGEALKIAIYILNKMSGKAINKTSYELWIDKKTNIKHLHIWDCLTKTQPYRLHERKWIQEQLVVILLAVLNALGTISFKIPYQDLFFKMGNAWFLKEVEFGKEENIMNTMMGFSLKNSEKSQQPQEVSLRRSIRERRNAIPDDYIVFSKNMRMTLI
ncbi:hypothetical protein CR513_04414, partial [Mucuna pruriens]